MTRAEKCYKPERDNKRGYCEWIPDSFAGVDGGKFIQRLLSRTLIPVGDKAVRFVPLDPTDIKFENWLKEKGVIKDD